MGILMLSMIKGEAEGRMTYDWTKMIEKESHVKHSCTRLNLRAGSWLNNKQLYISQQTTKQLTTSPPIEHSKFNPLEKPIDDCLSATSHQIRTF